MPTKRTRRTRLRVQGVAPEYWAMMMDEPLPEGGNPFARFISDKEQRALWEIGRETVLEDWIRTRPGTRPSWWWDFDAPREPVGAHPGCYYDGKLPQPRRRLGGTGTPAHEVLAYMPRTHYGIPMTWVTPFDVEYYGRRFRGQAIDPADPPIYESQAAYVERHGLLLPGERKRLRKADFEPEALLPEEI